jgi:hypothetical protein
MTPVLVFFHQHPFANRTLHFYCLVITPNRAKALSALRIEQQQVFNAIWANTGLRGNLFPETVGKDDDWLDKNEIRLKGEFVIRISDTSNIFYNFIKTR